MTPVFQRVFIKEQFYLRPYYQPFQNALSLMRFEKNNNFIKRSAERERAPSVSYAGLISKSETMLYISFVSRRRRIASST